ncbi:MAG: hypothetical protein WCA04_07145 [Geobacteraceae bacterium]
MKILLALLLVTAAAINASAFTGDRMGWRDQNGHLVQNTDERKTISGFGASVLLTTDSGWEKKWNTPAENTPEFTSADKLEIGKQGTILIFFANPELDSNDSVDVTCDIKITRPNSIITENSGLRGFTGKLLGPPENTYLTESIIRVVAEPTDPLGEWVVSIRVHDNIRQVTVPLQLKFTLVPADSANEPAMSEAELIDFMVNYYLHPRPEKLPQAVQAMHKMGYLQKETAAAPISSFLSVIFQSNSAAIESTLADFSSYLPAEQQILLTALWLADSEQSKLSLQTLLVSQDNKAGDTNADFLKSAPPKIDELPIESPEVLDMLWGAFMATGEEKYVIPIISVLPYSTINGDIPRLLVGGSAKWSLTSNAIQHKRVLDICVSQLEKQPKEVKKILSDIISKATKERTAGGVKQVSAVRLWIS